jgi:hypothetical protein
MSQAGLANGPEATPSETIRSSISIEFLCLSGYMCKSEYIDTRVAGCAHLSHFSGAIPKFSERRIASASGRTLASISAVPFFGAQPSARERSALQRELMPMYFDFDLQLAPCPYTLLG